MKQMLWRMVLVAALTGVGLARAEIVYLVEVSDLQKKVTREIMTGAELKDLKKTIDAETRVFAKAVELAKKEWEAAEKGEKPAPGEKVEKLPPATPFPNGTLSARRCQEKGSFTDHEKAQKRLDQIDTAEADLLAKQAKRIAGQPKAKNARELERAAVIGRAAMAVQDKIDELIKNPAAAAAKPAEAAAAPAEGAAKPAAGKAADGAAKPAAAAH
jgi:hypothetical protein